MALVNPTYWHGIWNGEVPTKALFVEVKDPAFQFWVFKESTDGCYQIYLSWKGIQILTRLSFHENSK